MLWILPINIEDWFQTSCSDLTLSNPRFYYYSQNRNYKTNNNSCKIVLRSFGLLLRGAKNKYKLN